MRLEDKLVKAIEKNKINLIEQVFEEIYYEYGNLVGFIISRYIHSKSDCEELINDVFIRFFISIKKTNISNIKYYLVTQAKNISIDFLRKKENRYEIVYNEELLDYIPSKENNNDTFDEMIEEMKTYLTIDEINIIVLHSVFDYSFVEIGKKYNKPINSIRSIYHRAIKKYRKGVNKNVF